MEFEGEPPVGEGIVCHDAFDRCAVGYHGCRRAGEEPGAGRAFLVRRGMPARARIRETVRALVLSARPGPLGLPGAPALGQDVGNVFFRGGMRADFGLELRS
ncbi:hypothetical protein CXX84_04730 [Arthrobacter sp. AFG7.2]|nr:hypothetical protein CXX84_04730 [Arthrobacter sp. AFG7.2]